MSSIVSRRAILSSAAVLGFAAAAGGMLRAREPALKDQLAELERSTGGRLGFAVLDSANGGVRGRRVDELFAMCSTFKFLVASLVLLRVDAGDEKLDRAIGVSKADIVAHSPVTETFVGRSMTIGELCHATMTTSDNAAANLLLAELQGPLAITAFARSLGDGVTRLDRVEPAMNMVGQGDERDTTSPRAMAQLMNSIVLGNVLTDLSRQTLIGWLRDTETGLNRLRASWPAEWQAGDKTGTGPDGPTNDIAIAWPPGRAPIIVTAYFDRTGFKMAENAKVLAEAGRLVRAMTQ